MSNIPIVDEAYVLIAEVEAKVAAGELTVEQGLNLFEAHRAKLRTSMEEDKAKLKELLNVEPQISHGRLVLTPIKGQSNA